MIKKYHHKKIKLLLGDSIFIVLAIYLAGLIRFGKIENFLVNELPETFFFVFVHLGMFYLFDLYNFRLRFKSTFFAARFIFALASATIIIGVTYYLIPALQFGRGIFLLNSLFILFVVFGWRILYQSKLLNGVKPHKIVIIGAGVQGKLIYEMLKDHDLFAIVGFLDDNPKATGANAVGAKILGPTDLLSEMVRNRSIEAAVLAIGHNRRPELLKACIASKMQGIEVYSMPFLYNQLTGKVPVMHIRYDWMIDTPFEGMRHSIYMVRIKRIIDIVFALTGLVLSLPISIITIIAIKLDSKGPVFYRQNRVGQNRAVYNIIKFRSMIANAEKNGAVWAKEKDDRVTRVGKIIRKLRIDEIPQMWNVLKGEMSFVGPRPERPEFVNVLEQVVPLYAFRHAVKPGITGWAQVNYRYGASKEDALDKLEYDLYYIKNLSLFLDLHVILKTIRVVLFVTGSR